MVDGAERAHGPSGRRATLRRRPGRVGAIALLAVAATACLPPGGGPDLLKRYDRYSAVDTSGLVAVSVFTTPVPGDRAGPLLKELAPSAQNAYVRSLADRTGGVEELQRSLAAPLAEPAGEGDLVDRTRFRRRLVLSVERRGPEGGTTASLAPGARIAWLRIAVGVDGSRARFTTWNRFATRYETVELGTMERSLDTGSGTEIGPLPGALARVLDRAGLQVDRTVVLDESLPLRERYVSNGILRSDSLILLQEGAAGIDLVGNSTVELEVRLAGATTSAGTVHRFEGLFDATGRPRPGDSLRLVSHTLLHPARASPVRARLRFESLVRSVVPGQGDDTYSEADDRVRFLRSVEEAGTIELVPGSELRSSVWSVVSSDCRFLQVRAPDPAPGTPPAALRFLTARDARRFVRWLREGSQESRWSAGAGGGTGRPITAAGRALYLAPGAPLRATEVDGLFVRLQPLNWRAEGYSVCP